MGELSNVSINVSEYDLPNNKGKGKVAVLLYTGSGDPKAVLDEAVMKYANGKNHHEFVDIHLDNPWTRVVLSNINDMDQKNLIQDDVTM